MRPAGRSAARPISASPLDGARARRFRGERRGGFAYFLSTGAGADGLPPDPAGNGEREAAAAFGLSCLGFFGSRPLRF
jgi:hypothetical protein